MAYEKEITTSTDDELDISSSAVMTEGHEIKRDESRPIFEPAEYYNGAAFRNYCWSQNINEIGTFTDLFDLVAIGIPQQIHLFQN